MAANNNFRTQIPSAREILKNIPNAIRQWSQKTPLQKYCYFYGIGKMAYRPIKFPTFEDDQTLQHYYSYTLLLLFPVHLFFILYTFAYCVNYGEFSKFLPATCLFIGPSISGTITLVLFVSKKRHTLHSLVDFAGRYIYRHDCDDIEHQRICSKQMDKTMKKFITKISLMIFGYTLAMTGPTYSYLFNRIRTTTIEVKVPFTDERSYGEFIINVILQMVYATLGGCGYIGLEVMLELLRNVITIAPKLVHHRLSKLIADFTENQISESQLRFVFKDIMKQSMDADIYVSTVSNVFYWRTLVTPVLFAYSIGMSIYCQYATDYVAGYGIAVMSWIQLLYICEMGEDMEDNGFPDALYDTEWYELPVDLQKDIMHLMNRKQNPVGLSIGPFGYNLNREIFKTITNKIYSFVIFLKDFQI